MKKHALLSPSGASRWMTCTPSAVFESQFPDTSSDYADEGTLAHSLAELLLQKALDLIHSVNFKREFEAIKESHFYSGEMLEYCENYRDFVLEKYNEAIAKTRDAVIFLETKYSVEDYVPGGFGTTDVSIIADGQMYVIDLKYGQGVPVDVKGNKQTRIYALGALKTFDYIYNIDAVEMWIYQPRINNVAGDNIPVVDLLNWAENELKPRALLASEGKGDFVPGNHCRFCRGKIRCRAFAEKQQELAAYDFKAPAVLSDAELSDILTRVDDFQRWAKDVKEYALKEAVLNGKKWDGFKLVSGRSARKYGDEQKVKEILSDVLLYDDYMVTSLRTITELEKKLGKKKFAELLGENIIKPPGAPTLVPANDPRAEISDVTGAAADFSGIDE